MDSQNILYTVNGILDFAKIQSGNIIIKNHPFSVSESIERITQTFRSGLILLSEGSYIFQAAIIRS